MSTNPVFSCLRPGSELHRTYFAGSLGGYADSLLRALSGTDEPSAVADLRQAAKLSGPAGVYDGLAMLQAALMPEPERLAWGRYMSPYSLATAIAAHVPSGGAVVDPAAGMGALLAATRGGSGLEKSPDLVRCGRLAQRLCPDDAPFRLDEGDAFDPSEGPRADTLVANPPWVLRAELPPQALHRLAAHPRYADLLRHERFDLCVPLLVEAVCTRLKPGGRFAAALPVSIATEHIWTRFRNGDLFQQCGAAVSLGFVDPPDPSAFPIQFTLCVGQVSAD
ncbi:hypothetical protein ABT369_50395 [Dactylosporangium sp. NPDC000244]|uniref:hypothetical protein n=1 Tax=Dactylosporangium sp. NPDC000244 TaxID=3154365 RepID=UPI00331EF7C6